MSTKKCSKTQNNGNKMNQRYKVLTPRGFKNFKGIRRSIKNSSILIITSNNKILECTLDHPIKTLNDGYTNAGELKIDDEIFTKDGKERICYTYINRSTSDSYYDAIDVEDGHEYYTNEIISHNCQFLGSSGTLIDGITLKTLQADYHTPLHESDGFSVYKMPEPLHTYVCIVDVSRGKGLDYSAFHIIDVTAMPYSQVATYRNNLITPVDYADVIFRTTKSYNNAYILIEINDIGGQVADVLHFDFEIETLLYTESAGRSGKRISSGFGKSADKGIRTTKQVKSIGCSVLKLLLEQQQLKLIDFNTINELSTFSRKGVSYEAESGCHDDLVMGLVLFAWLSTQTFFKDITDINTMMKLREKSDTQIMDELMPFGFSYEDLEDTTAPVQYNYNPNNW